MFDILVEEDINILNPNLIFEQVFKDRTANYFYFLQKKNVEKETLNLDIYNLF